MNDALPLSLRSATDPATWVLVVDDSLVVRRSLQELLESSGYRTEIAASGEEAFERCGSRSFDLVVTAQTMSSLSGLQLCRLLRSDPATAEIPVIVLAADDDRRRRFWARSSGADAFLSKSTTRTDLVPLVQQLLRDRPPRTQEGRPRPAGEARPLERLSRVLDELLFEAVVASEARRLIEHATDRQTFLPRVLDLVAEIADYSYLAVVLSSPAGPSSIAVHARGPWPEDDAEGLRALGLRPAEPGALVLVTREIEQSGPVVSRLGGVFPLQAGREELGRIAVHGGQARLCAEVRRTLEAVAHELGLVAKSLLLMEETRRLAQTDQLTGLANRRACAERLSHEIQRASRQGTPFCVALCDVDHFKEVNDRWGHGVGDEVLRAVASALRGSVRAIDLVGRWGGEEFIVLLPNASAAGGRVVAERLRAGVLRNATHEPGPERVTISVGVASFGGEDTDALVARADEALYRAKARGRNRIELG